VQKEAAVPAQHFPEYSTRSAHLIRSETAREESILSETLGKAMMKR
jgi:hypothetical protein